MKKRIAFIGTSYPVLYDSTRRVKSYGHIGTDHPVLDSPNGLVILYDELWFLCKDLCPIKMQGYSFVKYVDKMYPNIDYMALFKVAYPLGDRVHYRDENHTLEAKYKKEKEIINSLRLDWYSATGFSFLSSVCVGTRYFPAETTAEAYLFDLLIATELRHITHENIEVVSNIRTPVIDEENYAKDVMLTEKIIVHNIPNKIEVYGPRLDGILELRESVYLSDFRKWVIENHQHIQTKEIEEMQQDVQYQVDHYLHEVYLKALDNMNPRSVFLTESKTLVGAAVGFVPYLSNIYSVFDASKNTISLLKEKKEKDNLRWSGFIVQAEEIGMEIKRKG